MRDSAEKWEEAKRLMQSGRQALGPLASHSWREQPEHIAFQLARYRAANALIGNAERVVEFGAGEGIGVGILSKGRTEYYGIDIDQDSLGIARDQYEGVPNVTFRGDDCLGYLDKLLNAGNPWDAVVSIDVIEHIDRSSEETFMENAHGLVNSETGMLVVGTPSASFSHLASPQSQIGHINLYTHDRLYALMAKHFWIVQSFGMQDTAMHLGHKDARHYLLMCGISPR